MRVRVVSPVRGEVVELAPDGIEVISEAPLAPGQTCSVLMKNRFQARRLQGRIRWCISRPSVQQPVHNSPFVHRFFLEVRQMDPRVWRFLESPLETH